MNWILIALGAYFLKAVSALVDRFLLGKPHVHPLAYSFYDGMFSIFALLLVPFGAFQWPSLSLLLASVFAGIAFVGGLFIFFTLLSTNDASRVVPLIDSLTPPFLFFAAYALLGERLMLSEFFAVFFLVSAGILLARARSERGKKHRLRRSTVRIFFGASSAALLFALSYALTKYVFLSESFITGFVWTRLGNVFAASGFLLFKKPRSLIFRGASFTSLKTGILFTANKIIEGIVFVLVDYAIFLGSVTVVNALQGIQYAFLLSMGILISKKFPSVLTEEISPHIVLKKVFAVLFMGIGLAILVFR